MEEESTEWSFKIPGKTVSINTAYQVNFGTRERFLSREGKEYKGKVKQFMPVIKGLKKKDKIKLEIAFHEKWNRRKDIQNLDKLLIDAIFEKLNQHATEKIDDCQVWELTLRKAYSENKQFTMVKISKEDL